VDYLDPLDITVQSCDPALCKVGNVAKNPSSRPIYVTCDINRPGDAIVAVFMAKSMTGTRLPRFTHSGKDILE
jgi:hypothetical protein